MSYFAKIENDSVTEVIVAEQDFIDTLPGEWVETSLDNTSLRKNFAGVGYTYDRVLDAFIPPQPYASWQLDTELALWYAPIPMPHDGKRYIWDESITNWILI